MRSSHLSRLGRLALKELREILRDRRTIITLVLMPLLLYPLLSIAFKQLFLAGVVGGEKVPSYRLGFRSEAEWKFIKKFIDLGEEVLKERREAAALPPVVRPTLEFYSPDDLELAVRSQQLDLGLRLKDPRQMQPPTGRSFALDIEVLYVEGASSAADALDFLRTRLSAANQRLLAARLRDFNVRQRDEPVRAVLQPLANLGEKPGLSLAALVPLILILMTITGAVYPAIDLTAGERERGTLEVLVAAPLPRFSLLVAKYVAVMAVALLTALVNLVMMTLTVWATGLASVLFGNEGLSPGLLVLVLGLLVLFAAFFSALLLALTSFASSFKQAQAYLIPLMLMALGPGMLGLIPGLKLSGPLAVAPLVNIVLLARDLFDGTASLPMALVVICSTLLYATAALAVAARVFGAESVLYSSNSGWSELLRRPQEPRQAPTWTSTLACLAILFPAYFFVNSVLGQMHELPLASRLAAMAAAALALFLGVPLISVWWQRLPVRSALRLRMPPATTLLGGLLLGSGLWPFALELMLLLRRLGLATLRPELLEKAAGLIEEMRALSPVVFLATFAIIPAFVEEAFFRGFLYRGLEERLRPRSTILTTALLFGAFHLVFAQALAVERFVSSATIGLVLGWVSWRAGSIWPTILLHATHNGFIVLLALYQPELSLPEWSGKEQEQLPWLWLAAAAALAVFGAVLVQLGGRRPARPADSIPAD